MQIMKAKKPFFSYCFTYANSAYVDSIARIEYKKDKIIMKNLSFPIFLLLFNYCFSQTNIEKIKIGKYTYNIYSKNYFEYEINQMNLAFLISFNNKEYHLGTHLSYKNGENPYLLGLGNLKINKKGKKIICTFKNLIKDETEKFDSIVYVNKQRVDGSFEKISIVEYQNGKKKVIK